MVIETPLELEILSALHALLYDDSNHRNEKPVSVSTIYSYFKKLRQLDQIQESVRSLDRKGFVKVHQNSTSMDETEIKPTIEGEKFVLATVEPYWLYLPEWETKYPNVRNKILPQLNEKDDWLIFEKLYKNVSWRNDYQIDDEKARQIVDKDKSRDELPYYGKFREKIWRSSPKIADWRQRQDKDNKYPQVIRLFGRHKPIAIKSFEAFKTAKLYYPYFSEMYAESSSRYMSVRAFLKILKKYKGSLPEKLDDFFDHIISMEIIHISANISAPDFIWKVQISLNACVDADNWEKWELNYITQNFNTQQSLHWELTSGNIVELNNRSLELEAPKRIVASPFDDGTTVGDDITPITFVKPLPKVEHKEVDKTVFVVHGRNEKIKNSMFDFLRSVGLNPMEWNEWIKVTGKTSPYVGEVLNKAFEIAQVVVVLLTPDDEVKLRDEFHLQNEPNYEKQLTPQARPNVIFEAGMAMGKKEDRTIIVVFGDMRPISDLLGRHEVRMSNSHVKREELLIKLETARCPVDRSADEWKTIGDFSLDDVKSQVVKPEKTRVKTWVEMPLGILKLFYESKINQLQTLNYSGDAKNKLIKWHAQVAKSIRIALSDEKKEKSFIESCDLRLALRWFDADVTMFLQKRYTLESWEKYLRELKDNITVRDLANDFDPVYLKEYEELKDF